MGMRHCLEAPVGHVFCIIDSAQIEARVTAWLCGEWELLEDFASGGDPYKKLAAKIFEKPIDQITKEERFVGKTGVLQFQYYAGWRKFATIMRTGAAGLTVDISDERCQDSVNTYRRNNPNIVQSWYSLGEHVSVLAGLMDDEDYAWPSPEREIITFAPGRIKMPNGLDLLYPNVHKREGDWVYGTGREEKLPKLHGGILLENIVQSLSRIVVGLQMLAISKRYRVVTMAHDEVVYLVRRKEAKEAFKFGMECFRWVPDPIFEGLPLDADGVIDKKYIKP